MPDRLQYVIGTLISIILLSGYLVLSGDQEEKPAVAENDLQEISVAKKDPGEARAAKEANEQY